MDDLIKREDALKAFESEMNGVKLDFAILVVDRFLQERDCDIVWDAVRCLRDCVEGSKWNIEHLPSAHLPDIHVGDIISRQAAINAICMECHDGICDEYPCGEIKALEQLPSAQQEITLESAIDYLDSIGWMQNHDKQMYEMGLKKQLADDSDSYDALLPSAQPERKKGNWILIADGYTDYVKCDQCGNISYVERNFCPSCGADMRIKETDNDYERAVDQLEHDILYEPTFNQDDGSM